ncbi:MAG TPA: hypothetical protein VEV17_01395 [Bryobacteraceae bacterium]|nr:hypothetical protein [Bryobacteraceae bacterium]
MVNKLLLGFAFLALAVASAATSYNVTFWQPVVVNGSKLSPGDYKVEIQGNMAVIKQGKKMTEAPVKIENDGQKFSTNSIRLEGDRLSEIRVGGTHTRLIFENSGNATN